jgi:anti-sigma factor RsiW
VNHLGEQISALIDGELTGADLDRASAHLAACGRCRAEAAELRQLKRDLRALFEVDGDDALTRRLLAMAGPGGPVPSRRFRREQHRRERARDNRDKLPPPDRERDGGMARPRGRYVLWSAISVVVVGVGAAAFTMGGSGGTASPGPKVTVTPQLEMFSVEHAIVSGDVPFPDPAQAAVSATSP